MCDFGYKICTKCGDEINSFEFDNDDFHGVNYSIYRHEGGDDEHCHTCIRTYITECMNDAYKINYIIDRKKLKLEERVLELESLLYDHLERIPYIDLVDPLDVTYC